MVLLAEVIRTLPKIGTAYQTLFGILLIVIIIYLPNGLVGDFATIRKWFRLPSARKPEPAKAGKGAIA
jgi:branched-chain amino acid transport system permease protein